MNNSIKNLTEESNVEKSSLGDQNSTKTDDNSTKTDRKSDIYVGVDVFGRGCMGGGGFECSQPMKIIREKVKKFHSSVNLNFEAVFIYLFLIAVSNP